MNKTTEALQKLVIARIEDAGIKMHKKISEGGVFCEMGSERASTRSI